MTNKEQWMIRRMEELSMFQNRLEEIEVQLRDASVEQKIALESLYDAIDNLVLADTESIGVINNA